MRTLVAAAEPEPERPSVGRRMVALAGSVLVVLVGAPPPTLATWSTSSSSSAVAWDARTTVS